MGRPRHNQIEVDISIKTNEEILDLLHFNEFDNGFPEDPSSFVYLHTLGNMNDNNAKRHVTLAKAEIKNAIHYDMMSMGSR